MRAADTAEVHVLECVGRAGGALRINPLVGARSMPGLPATQQQRATGDERRVELVASLRILAINMET